ncbi:MAG: response regulator transcription factor [Clostridia bacterium]|nr:response regulator transcription factor [Clostridia bacterium]MBQ6233182.1 response regulator transcription factor [Clostridia bacterium]
MAKKKMIMIVDDEIGIHESLRIYLTREGYEVFSVFRGDEVMSAFERMRPDLVILDIMMPGRSGTQVCTDIRAVSMTPIIILTAKGEEVDKLLGFALGADDYIVKPFSPREVVSRIAVIFRRLNRMESEPDNHLLTIGHTSIDLKCYEVRVDGQPVVLSPKEVEILHLMASHPRQVFTREQLLDNIWGFDFDGDPRVVDTSIKRIRKKLPENAGLILRSVYGVGYKVEPEENA